MNVALRVLLCLVFMPTIGNVCPQTLNSAKNEDVANFEKRYSTSVQRFKDFSLSEIARDPQAEVYRMMIFPTWGNAISIKVQKHDGIYALSARRLNGQAGFKVGNLTEQKHFDLTQSDSRMLDDLILKLNLFEMPHDDGVIGVDGDEWVIEGVSQGKYHFVVRWCATDYNPKKRGVENFNALCKFLVDKSKLSARPTNKRRALI
jgi:hypothetical protein